MTGRKIGLEQLSSTNIVGPRSGLNSDLNILLSIYFVLVFFSLEIIFNVNFINNIYVTLLIARGQGAMKNFIRQIMLHHVR